MSVSASIDPVAIQVPTDHKVWSDLVQTFRQAGAATCIADYVKAGPEINEALRSGTVGGFGAAVKCLDKFAVLFSRLIRGARGDYVVLNRTMNKGWSAGSRAGFVSTSNQMLAGFGQERMRIYVPLNTPVLVADITEQIHGSGASSVPDSAKVYEIILPRETVLDYRGSRDGVAYYIALYKGQADDALIERIVRAVARDLGPQDMATKMAEARAKMLADLSDDDFDDD